MSPSRAPGRRPRRAAALRAAILAAAAALTALAAAVTAGPRAATAVLTAASSPAAPSAPAGCGLSLDPTCYVASAITSWFAGLVTSAVNPLVAWIGQTALSTPQPDSVPAVQGMWQSSLAIVDVTYVLLVLIGGIIVMSHETLQTSYSAKEIAPRVVIGFITANLSMLLMSRAVDLANALSSALAGGGTINPSAAAQQLLTTLGNSAATDNGIFLILLALAGVILALVLAIVYVIRVMAVVLLAAAAPILLALYALPQTAWAARWWWRALTAALAVQAAQGLVLTAALRVFFSPGWLPGPGGYLEQVLTTLCLLYILMRIPSWIARPVLSPFGRSPLRRAIRFAFTAAVLSRVAPVLRGTAGRGAARRGGAAGRQPGGRTPGGSAGTRTGTAGARTGGAASTPGGTAFGIGSGAAPARWVQPPLLGMPSAPRRPRHQQLALFDVPPSIRQPRPDSPPPPPDRGGRRGPRQPPLPGMPSRPARPRQLELQFDPPVRRTPRTPPPPPRGGR
jgi:hypothetical protein